MNVREFYNNIKNNGKDFFDTFIGEDKSTKLFSGLTNTEMLNFLKNNRPFLYEFIIDAYEEYWCHSLLTMSEREVNETPSEFIFYLFNNDDSVDINISTELFDFSEDGKPYIYSEDELKNLTIIILSSNFKSMETYMLEQLSK